MKGSGGIKKLYGGAGRGYGVQEEFVIFQKRRERRKKEA